MAHEVSLRQQLTEVYPTDPPKVQALLDEYFAITQQYPNMPFGVGCFMNIVKHGAQEHGEGCGCGA